MSICFESGKTSIFHFLCPGTPTPRTAARLWETFTFTFWFKHIYFVLQLYKHTNIYEDNTSYGIRTEAKSLYKVLLPNMKYLHKLWRIPVYSKKLVQCQTKFNSTFNVGKTKKENKANLLPFQIVMRGISGQFLNSRPSNCLASSKYAHMVSMWLKKVWRVFCIHET